MTPNDSKCNRISLNPVGVYLHIPFCFKKCSYCSFYSVEGISKRKVASFINAVRKDIRLSYEWYLKRFHAVPQVKSIYFGGGTPSLLDPGIISSLLINVSELFPLLKSCEVTVELNPETVTRKYIIKLSSIKEVSRLSLGVQSFFDRYLKFLDRSCTSSQIFHAIELIKEFNYVNFNLDIISGIPGETILDIEKDLDIAISMNPKHISVYMLTLKRGHPFYKKLPNEVVSAKIYKFIRKKLIQSGFRQYEISNFSKPGFESIHNLIYWNGGDFLGFGPSAASRVFINGVFYHRKFRKNVDYYLVKRTNNFRKSTFLQTILEACFLELRKSEGIDLRIFYERYGYDLLQSNKLGIFLKEDLLQIKDGKLKLTPKGMLLTDYIAMELVDINLIKKAPHLLQEKK